MVQRSGKERGKGWKVEGPLSLGRVLKVGEFTVCVIEVIKSCVYLGWRQLLED